jgi:hypothetical protein
MLFVTCQFVVSTIHGMLFTVVGHTKPLLHGTCGPVCVRCKTSTQVSKQAYAENEMHDVHAQHQAEAPQAGRASSWAAKMNAAAWPLTGWHACRPVDSATKPLHSTPAAPPRTPRLKVHKNTQLHKITHFLSLPHSLNLWEEIPLLFALWLAGVVGYPHSTAHRPCMHV